MKFTTSKNYTMKNTILLCLLSLVFSACSSSLESSSEVEKGIVQSEFSFKADWTSPTGEKFTKNPNVRINLQYYAAATVQIYNNGECLGLPLNTFPYQAEIPLTLSGADGIKEAGVKFKTTGGETSECFADSINLYRTPLAVTLTAVDESHPITFDPSGPNEETYFYIKTTLAKITVNLNGHPYPVGAYFSYRSDCSESIGQNAGQPMYFNIPPTEAAYKLYVEYKDFSESVGCHPLDQIIVDDKAPATPKIFPIPLIQARGSFIADPSVTVLNINALEPLPTSGSRAQVGFKELNYRITPLNDNVGPDWHSLNDTAGNVDFDDLLDKLKTIPQLYTVEISAIDKLKNRSEVLKIPWSVSEANFFLPSKRVSGPGYATETFKIEGFTDPIPLIVSLEAQVCNKTFSGNCSDPNNFSQEVSVVGGDQVVIKMPHPPNNQIKTAYVNFHGRKIPWSVATNTELCPLGFLLSPPPSNSNAAYLSEFCIAEMEMRWEDTTLSSDANTIPDVRTKEVSVKSGSGAYEPIYNISHADMTHLCSKLKRPGSTQNIRGRLPSTAEWNYIADDILKTNSNLKTSAPNEGELFIGNTKGSLLKLNTSAPCDAYAPPLATCSNPSTSTWGLHNRAHLLSTNTRIFDFSGNLSEATQEIFDVANTRTTKHIIKIGGTPADLDDSPWDKIFKFTHTCDDENTNGCHLGVLNSNVPGNASHVVLRGGSFTSNSTTPPYPVANENNAGIYTLETRATAKHPDVGFRCVTDVYR